MAPLPIKFTELLMLNQVGVDPGSIGFNTCVRPRPRPRGFSCATRELFVVAID